MICIIHITESPGLHTTVASKINWWMDHSLPSGKNLDTNNSVPPMSLIHTTLLEDKSFYKIHIQSTSSAFFCPFVPAYESFLSVTFFPWTRFHVRPWTLPFHQLHSIMLESKRTCLKEEVDNSSTASLSSEPPKSLALSSSSTTTLPPIVSPPEDSSLPAKKLLPAGTNIYWDSADAKLLFNASGNETSLDRLDDLITRREACREGN
jgi:hypothetical protein